MIELAPTLLSWFYHIGRITRQDSFVMGDSGYGYLYPSQLSLVDKVEFVNLTLQAAEHMDISAVAESENCCQGDTSSRKEWTLLFNDTRIRGVLYGVPGDFVGDVAVV